ncbi:Sex-determining fem-1 [Fusarium sp. NRRL 52700]|nr:Sex-determining fem-1 [Fusarium sp. NRRL 52700]
MTSEQRGPVFDLLTSRILLVGDKFDHSQASHLIPRLAMSLVMGIPEYFPGEHLLVAQIITTGTTEVMMLECLKLVFHTVSNNMVLIWEANDFKDLYTIISSTGLLGAIDSLRRARQQDLTIRAFMDNLFRDLIMSICYYKRTVNKEIPNALVKWLLSLGQDPNIEFLTFSIKTALEHAILSRQVDLIESPLKAGAVDERHFEQTLDIGADLSLPIKTLTDDFLPARSNVVGKETALSTAAAVNIHAISAVLDLLQTHNPAIEAASFITPDIFISAACAGNADMISFLHGINPIGFRRNARGVMPLEVAIKYGHQEAYRLLFQLYRQSSATLLLIPMFTHQLDILQYLLQNGLDVNLVTKEDDIDACRVLVQTGDRRPNFDTSLTVLELLLYVTPFTDDFKDGIKLLVRSGASLTAEAILRLSSAGHDDILLL